MSADTRVGRYVVKGGRVTEWEIDNGADGRPDGIYELRAVLQSEPADTRVREALAELVACRELWMNYKTAEEYNEWERRWPLAWEAARRALASVPAPILSVHPAQATNEGKESGLSELLAEIDDKCSGDIVWRAMNAEGTGYSMQFDWKPDGERWFAENPIASRGYRLVEAREFSESMHLANRAASALRILTTPEAPAPASTGEPLARPDEREQPEPVGEVQRSGIVAWLRKPMPPGSLLYATPPSAGPAAGHPWPFSSDGIKE